MTARDIGRAGIAASALLASALLLLPADAEAGRQCSRSERVDHRNAECLYAWWKNRGVLRKSPYHVSNQCSQYGKVVAKVDLVSASDRTIHLIDDNPRDGDTRHRIRSISCCSDMGICNRADAVTDAGCLARFWRESSASMTCRVRSASAAISGDNYNCTITAICDSAQLGRRTTITAPFVTLGNVNNCNGHLRHGSCHGDNPDTPRMAVFDTAALIAVGLSDAARDYSLGWRLVRNGDAPDGTALELAVTVRRRESAADGPTPPEHAVGFRATSLF